MHVVALVDAPAFSPTHARRLAAVLGCSLPDAAGRLRIPGRGPAVVGHFVYMPPATTRVSALEGAGFSAIVLGPPTRTPLEVHAVGIDERGLHFDTGDGRQVMSVDDVAVVVWGVRILEKDAITRDVVFRGRQSTERWGFVWIFTTQGDVAQIEESRMRGVPEGGFSAMAEAIRRACGRATFDDRLLATRAQQQILGPDLNPAQHLGLAVRLVAQAHMAAAGVTPA